MLLKCSPPTPFNGKLTIQSSIVLLTITFWLGYARPNMLAQLVRCNFPLHLSSNRRTTHSLHQIVLLAV